MALCGKFERKISHYFCKTMTTIQIGNAGFVELLETFGSDLTVVNAARVSFAKESTEFSDKDKGLIKYLAKHNHVSPFFHPQIRMRIKMPIFLAREWYRHTVGFARNEVSRRYVDEEPEFFIPEVCRERDPKLKQGSKLEEVKENNLCVGAIKEITAKSLHMYKALLEQGVCPEQARIILPQSMYTEFIETASLAAYARLCKLRLDPGAQKEVRDYANAVVELLKPKFPASWEALCAEFPSA
jgi:thymidylate synthase (FAD)